MEMFWHQGRKCHETLQRFSSKYMKIAMKPAYTKQPVQFLQSSAVTHTKLRLAMHNLFYQMTTMAGGAYILLVFLLHKTEKKLNI